MGGGGEGLLTVIQGLPAGLAIVLLDRRRQELESRRRVARRELKDLRSSRASDPAATSTTPCRSAGVETDPISNINTSAQICDGQYASTYQLAHCSLTPTSPPVEVPEFPPQRPTPCRNQGNFEVGGCGSAECPPSPSPPARRPRGGRGGRQGPDRGSVCSPRPQLERDDAFANSLRKYPNAPDGPPSAELVQRLLRNTQAKLVKKTHSKSLRNLKDLSPTASKTNFKKSSKNLQTYTRSRRSEREREQSVNNHEIKRSSKKQRGPKAPGRLQSPGCSKEIRVRDTFDYLNSNIPRPPPGKTSGDRHTVKDTIRDSLRAVYGDGLGPVAAFNLCPRTQSRYERHIREHHGAGTSKQCSIDEAHGLKVHSSGRTLCDPNCPNQPTSRSKEMIDVTPTCGCGKTDIDCGNIDIDKCVCRRNNTESKCKEKLSAICECDKSEAEIDNIDIDKCSPDKLEIDECECSSRKLKTYKCNCRSKKSKLCSFEDDIEEGQELEKIIRAWLEELPVSSREKPNNKIKRACLTKKLCETLSSIKDNKFDAKGKEEIKKCIDKMPIWLPHDKNECETFKDRIADGLFEKLKEFRQRNTFKDVIDEWLDGIDFEDENEIDRNALALDLSNALKKMDRKRSPNERLYMKKLKFKILDWLEYLPIQTFGDKNDALEKLADELIYKLPHYKGAKISVANPEIEPYVNEIISSLNELPELTELSVDEKQRVSINLLDKLPKILLERNEDDNIERIRSILRFIIIRNWLSQLAKDNKVEIDKPIQQEFVKNLILTLAEANESKNNKNEHELILDFIRELPTSPDSNDPELKKMVEELSNEIEDLQPDTRSARNSSTVQLLQHFGSQSPIDQSPTSDTNEQLLTTTENWLKKWFESSGTHVDPKTIPILAKKLAEKLSKIKRKTSFSSPMLTEILDFPQTSERPLVNDSSNRTNEFNITDLESKFNDILENLVVRQKDESIAGELMSLLHELERVIASGNISNDIYNRLLSRVHEMSENSNNEDILDFMRDDSGRKWATSTPRRQSRGRDGSHDEKEPIRKVESSTPRGQNRSRDGSTDEEEKHRKMATLTPPRQGQGRYRSRNEEEPIRKVATSAPRRQSRGRDGSTDEEEKHQKVATSTPPRQGQGINKSRNEEEPNRKVATSTPSRQGQGRYRSHDEEEPIRKVATSTLRRQGRGRDRSRDEKEQIQDETTSTPRRQSRGRDGNRNEKEQFRKMATSTPQRQGRGRDGNRDEEEQFREEASSAPRRQDRSRNRSRNEVEQIRKVATSTPRRQDRSRDVSTDEEDKHQRRATSTRRRQDRNSDGNRDEEEQIRGEATSTPQRQGRGSDGSGDEEELIRGEATSTPRRQSRGRDGSRNEEEQIRKMATSTPQRQGRDSDGSRNEKQQIRRVSNSIPRRQSRSRDRSTDEEENIKRNENKDVRRPSYYRDRSKDERQTSPNRVHRNDCLSKDEGRSGQSKNISGDESPLTSSKYKRKDQRQPGTSKSQDESNFYKDLHDIIQDWINQLNLNLQNKDKELAVTDIANDLEDRRKYLQVNPNAKTSDEEELEHMKYQIFKRLNKLTDAWTINTIMPEVRKLMDSLKEKLAKLANSTDRGNHVSDDTSPMSQIDDVVRNWCNDLPLPDTTEGDAKKQDLHDKIILKIGELNMNPKTLNDDTLYEDMLFDNIDEQLSGLPINNTDNIKAALMRTINRIREILKENWAGQAYKQQLRDSITKSSPSTSNLTEDEQASFEIMKDNLADAFINLYYNADDENLRIKFKDKIKKEIDGFCADYLKRHPDKPLNATQLNKDLNSALKKVDVPRDESMRSEVELSKIKDVIEDWTEDLPLDEKTTTEKLQRNKNTTLLAKRLHELEKENELTPNEQYEQKIRHEIEKYLKKLLLEIKTNLKDEIDRLIDRVKNTKHSRTFTCGSSCSMGRSPIAHRSGPQTSGHQSVDQHSRTFTCGSRCSMGERRSGPQTSGLQSIDQERSGPQFSKLQGDQGRSGPQGSRLTVDKGKHNFQNCPMSCLGRDDQAHLQRIRERITRQEESERKTCYPDSKSFVKQSSDAAVNPMDHGSQLNMVARHQRVQCMCSKPGTRSPVIQSPCSSRSQLSQVPMTQCRCQPGQVSTGSQVEISPYVVVKDFFWDNPPMPDVPRPSSPPTPLPVLSSCSILPQSKPLPHRHSRNRPQPTMKRSFNDDEYTAVCRRPMAPRHCGRPIRDDFSCECPKDEHDHGSPRRMWSRPHIYRDNEGISPCYSSERKESSVRCGCGGKISKCRIRNPVICELCNDDPMKYCPRCCGTLCPHPTDFYFR